MIVNTESSLRTIDMSVQIYMLNVCLNVVIYNDSQINIFVIEIFSLIYYFICQTILDVCCTDSLNKALPWRLSFDCSWMCDRSVGCSDDEIEGSIVGWPQM
jgi:hypothetical protein